MLTCSIVIGVVAHFFAIFRNERKNDKHVDGKNAIEIHLKNEMLFLCQMVEKKTKKTISLKMTASYTAIMYDFRIWHSER